MVALSSALVAEAAQAVLVLRPGGASWQVQEAEKVTVNDRDKLRIASSKKLELRGDEYKKLTSQMILRAGLIRRHADGYFVVKNGANWVPVLPDGASVKDSISYAALWSSARIAIQKDRDKKSVETMKQADLFAVLPGGDRNEALANLLADEANFRGVGEKYANTAFDEWKSAVMALAPSVTGPAGERIQQQLLSGMQSADQKLRSGIAHNSDLEFGLQYVAVSKSVYPKEERQEKARAALEQMKAWRDQQIAILRAFSVASLWDAFIEKYGEFARWDNSFYDIKKLHEKAFFECMSQHRAEGKRLEQEKKYELALRELQAARACSPGDVEIGTLIEELRIKNNQAFSDMTKKPAEDRSSATQTLLRRHLADANRYIEDKQLDEAENEINQAASLDKESPAILLSRARLARGRNQLLKAIEILDQYDRRVTASEDREQGEDLRGRINYDLKKGKQSLKAAIARAKADGDYVQASRNAEEGLALDGNDLDFLFEAGLGRAILRKNAEAEQLLNKYLRLSQATGSDTKGRQEVYDLLPKVKETIPEPQGTPNWFSGYKSPAGVFYCPVSLMPNARPAEVRASHKQSTTYDWNKDALREVHVTTQQPGDRDFTAYFEYFADGKSVKRVSTEAISDAKEAAAPLRFTPNGPVGGGKGVYTALLNNPAADPLMIEKLTGKRVAAIVAGNPYFHPFAWDGAYLFIAEYDDQGRVKSAKQIPTAGQEALARVFEFRWEGLLLKEIAERQTGDYQRTMTYAGGKLIAETISFRGKKSKIEYKYKSDQLLEAYCSDDPSLGGRSRHVTFQ
jgi:hypothetical protein